MKSIILFRHAKSDWSDIQSEDHERQLNKRGVKAAKKMGIYLRYINQIPDIVISSTAIRTKKTLEIAMRQGNWKSKVKIERDIYNSSVKKLFSIIHKIEDIYTNACLVGHEPTISSFIYETTKYSINKFPTASMAKIEFKIKKWKYINTNSGMLTWFKKPKEINI